MIYCKRQIAECNPDMHVIWMETSDAYARTFSYEFETSLLLPATQQSLSDTLDSLGSIRNQLYS